ncbi:unnamed protein product, partial [Trichogramma brassicae]
NNYMMTFKILYRIKYIPFDPDACCVRSNGQAIASLGIGQQQLPRATGDSLRIINGHDSGNNSSLNSKQNPRFARRRKMYIAFDRDRGSRVAALPIAGIIIRIYKRSLQQLLDCCSCYIYNTKEILACGAVYAFIHVCACVPSVCGIACAFPNQCHNELNPIKAGTHRIYINIIGRMPRGCEEKNRREANFTVCLVITRVTYNIYQKKNLAAGARTGGQGTRTRCEMYTTKNCVPPRDLIPPPPLPLAMGFATEDE